MKYSLGHKPNGMGQKPHDPLVLDIGGSDESP